MSRLLIALVLALSGNSTAALWQSSPTCRVIIVVQEEGTRTRIGGAGVRVMTPGLVVDVEGVTGADGTFQADVPTGNYEVAVWAANYTAAHDPVRDGLWSPLPRRTEENVLVYKTTHVNVAVRPGERRSLAFELSPAAPAPAIAAPRAITGSISGRVVPASSPVEVLLQNLDERGDGISRMIVPVDRSGAFTIGALRSARYGLRATSGRQMATAIVDVDAAPVSDVELRLEPGAVLRGVCVGPPLSRSDDELTYISLIPAGPGARMFDDVSDGAAEEQRSFGITNIFGRRRVWVVKRRDWIAEAVLLADGRNVLYEEIDFSPGQVYDNVRVVLSNKAATIRGTVQIDWRRVPPGGVVVTVFPEDPALWRVDSGWVHRTDPDENGYEVRGVRPGRAYLVAPHSWNVPRYPRPEDFYRALAKSAKRVFVGKPGKYRVDLTIR